VAHALRQHLSAVFATRASKIALALAVVTAGALCFVPGFNALNYYSSLALALVLSLLTGVASAVSAARARLELPAEHEAALRGPFSRNAAMAGYLAAAALVPLLFNALFVKNCDMVEGFAFFLLGAGLSAVFASQLGTLVGLLRWTKKAWLAGLLFIGAFLLWVLYDLLHFYNHPPIFAYNPFSGFFSGAIYDDLIELDSRLMLYRLNNVVQIGLMWSLAALTVGGDLSVVGRNAMRASRGAWAAAVGCVIVVSAMYGARGAIGYEMSRDAIVQQLGGRIGNDRLELIYDRESITPEQAALMFEDHTFRLAQLEATLGDRFDRKITSYVYKNNAQKRALMGADRVFIAKPWQSEIHIAAIVYAAPVVHHELAHVVLGKYADGMFDVPTQLGVLPHVALVEGAAEAMEWYGGQLTAHQWAAAMRREGIAPNLVSIVGPEGFWKQSASKAYTLAGSFIRWLIDTQGAEKLKTAYRDGDFEEAYGTTLPDLVAGWETFLDTQVALPKDAMALAKERFSVRGVLMRVCPLEIPRVEAKAKLLLSTGQVDDALELRKQVIEWVPDSSSKRLALIATLAREGRVEETRAAYEQLAALDKATRTAKARGREFLADALWRKGDAKAAAGHYAAIVGAPLSEFRRRNVLAKLVIARSADMEPVLGPYLMSPAGTADEAIEYLSDAVVDLSDEPLAPYLLARRLYGAKRYAEAVGMFQQALLRWRDEMPEEDQAPLRVLVERETYRLMGQAYYFNGQLDDAEAAFKKAVELAGFESDRLTWKDWLARVAWKRTQ